MKYKRLLSFIQHIRSKQYVREDDLTLGGRMAMEHLVKTSKWVKETYFGITAYRNVVYISQYAN